VSSLVVPITTISDIRPHPNADTLDIAQVLGWQVVIKRGTFKTGDNVIYFPIDTVLPVELSDRLEVTQYLSKQRIRATRLRGEPSFGLVIPCEDAAWEPGQNVAEHYGAVKWEPPCRDNDPSNHWHQPHEHPTPRHPLFIHYTDIENLRHYPDILDENELVVVTEKIHGTNNRIGIIEGEWLAGSHNVERGPGDELYWSPKPVVERLIEYLGRHHKQVILFGEIFGAAVQSLDYGAAGHAGYRAFDLYVDGHYLDWATFELLCHKFNVPTAPLLDFDTFNLETIRLLSEGPTMLEASHLREGVVVKPLVEHNHPKIGRVVLKYVSDTYLLAKKTDFKEE